MVIKEGYKQTEIGVIPIDWEVRTFDELTDKIIGGGTPSRSNSSFWGNEIPWVTVKDFATFNPFTTQEYITKIGLQNSASHLIPKGIIITSTRMALGKAVIYDIDVSINQDLKAIYPKNIIDTNFFYYWFQFNAKKIEELGSGSTVMGLSLPDLRKIKLKIPTHKEQTAIATALSDVDGLITGLEKLIAKKRNIKQGAMQQLLQPKDGWEVKKLGECLKVKHGKSQKEVEDKNGKYPIFGTGGLMSYTNSYLCDKPSVLIGRKGTIDKPQFMDSPFWTVDTLFYTEIFQNISAKFIYYRFLLIDWYSFNEASGVPSLNAKTIENIEISTPHYVEQTRIATILSDMDAELSALEQKLEKYKKVKLGMMQELLTGKTRLN
jgi:type I restriction enzyme S subunit